MSSSPVHKRFITPSQEISAVSLKTEFIVFCAAAQRSADTGRVSFKYQSHQVAVKNRACTSPSLVSIDISDSSSFNTDESIILSFSDRLRETRSILLSSEESASCPR